MKLFKSFFHAFRGFSVATNSEFNLKIHIIIALLVIIAGSFFNITVSEFIICLLLFALVISTELINTCIEGICNILRDKYKLAYKDSQNIRDIAASAVLFNAIIASIIGLLIFLPYLNF